MSLPASGGGNHLEVGQIAGIPIRFSPWYGLLLILVYSRSSGLAEGTLWLIVLTGSVLIHELGHGMVARHYKLGPTIVLHAFGGWCAHLPTRSRQDDFKLVAAGPAASLALAALFWTVGELLPEGMPWWVTGTVRGGGAVNIFWGMFNLLPVFPLDGGRLFELALGTRTSDRRASDITSWVGFLVGAVIGVLGLMQGDLFITVLMGFLAWQCFNRIGGADFQKTLFAPFKERPATRTRLGVAVPSDVWGLSALLAGLYGVQFLLDARHVRTYLETVALYPAAFLDGESLWTVLTYGWVMADWGPALLTVTALVLAGPVVHARLGGRGFLGLWVVSLVGAGVIGAGSGVWLPDWARQGAFGPSGAVWALLATGALLREEPLPLRAGLAIDARVALGALFLVDSLGFWVAGADWSWPMHLGGVVIGTAASGAPRLREWWVLRNPPPVDLS